MTFKERRFECRDCGLTVKALLWDHEPPPDCLCGGRCEEASLALARHRGVIDDQLEGGARWCETMGHEPVWLDGTKSQYRKMVEKHNVQNVVRHDNDYYVRQRRQHDERIRDERRA